MSATNSERADRALHLEYCGTWHQPLHNRPFAIGREGDLIVDDNPYLHRRFLEVTSSGGLWNLTNVGRQLSATLRDPDGRFSAHLGPGASVPLVFGETLVRFAAGSTTYELLIRLDDPPFIAPVDEPTEASGEETIGQVSMTPDQLLLVLALAEAALRRSGTGPSEIPSTSEAAARLGWTDTKFNRKLDNVCQKLKKTGVQGLHGGSGRNASNRRARLVEYCLAARIVTADDLDLLPDR